MKIGNVYRHHKGGYYKVLGLPLREEDLVKLVYYVGTDGKTWIRTLKNFNSPVEIRYKGSGGHHIHRFNKVIDDPNNPFKEKQTEPTPTNGSKVMTIWADY